MTVFKVIIPARYGSTRLPGKVLADIAGKPMIRHVYERALASAAKEVIVATDDQRIVSACREFGADVLLTAETHRSGTERLLEVVEIRNEPDDLIVVNVQADEPLLPASLIEQAAGNLASRPDFAMATLCERIESAEQVLDRDVVKVVFDQQGKALYFSRAAIPCYRAQGRAGESVTAIHYRHIGIYAYRVDYLRRYRQSAPCELERAESLEQLRALFHGEQIHVAEALEAPGPGVDTPDDLTRVRALLT